MPTAALHLKLGLANLLNSEWEGDWFEAELEFWRNQIQPGMGVIDVGANVGLYVASAAQRVGAADQVLAVEPFPFCIQCLRETQRINGYEWLSLCAGAASDHPGTAHLALHRSSEMNEVVRDGTASQGNYEEISCFTLDERVEQEAFQRLDWLKIDAEGHEMQVMIGSDRLLDRFSPAILYENIAGGRRCCPIANSDHNSHESDPLRLNFWLLNGGDV